jgi:Peptidase of plants and bacteria/F5/8 type C domain
MARLICALALALLVDFTATRVARKAEPVLATIETTLATAKGQIGQFAFDGDPSTFFASEQNPAGTDHFTLVFDKPVKVKSIGVLTGRADGSEALDDGKLAVSADGKSFRELAPFAQGKSQATLTGESIVAVRIQPGAKSDHHLAIRELTVESDPPVAVFKYPVEFAIDVADEPKMKDWAKKVARVCTLAYPMINEELKSDGFKPPTVVTLALKTGYRGVAFASGGRITGSVKYFQEHPDDVGAMVHEATHVVQHYNGRGNPGWLVEGVSDYVRFFKFEPGKIGRINAARAHYNGSYRVTAAFLAYVTEKYDKQLVRKLNKAMREGRYKKEIFKELTGKSVEELDEDWVATLKR